jgi:PA-IL-like protein
MFKSKFLRVSLALSLILTLSILTFGDTIRLKNGSIIKGKIINFANGQFTIVFGDGTRQRQMNYYADEIEAIEFDNSSPISNSNSSKISTISVSNNGNQNTVINTNKGNETTNKGNETKPEIKQPNQPPPTNSGNSSRPQPIKINSKVLADNTSNGWTNTGWVVKKGQKIRVSGTGRISLGNGRYSTPSGVSSLPDNDKLMKDKPTGGLILVIGDDNNDFVFVGASNEFIAKRDGALFLGVNEGMLDDNSGAFEVTIEIDPSTTD